MKIVCFCCRWSIAALLRVSLECCCLQIVIIIFSFSFFFSFPPSLSQPEVMSAMAAAATLPAMSRVPVLPVEYQSGEVPPLKTSDAPASTFSLPASVIASASSTSASAAAASSASRAPERERDRERDRDRDRDRGRERDKEKKKKKHHKRRSRSRSRSKSKSKSKHGLPSAYRRLRRSRFV